MGSAHHLIIFNIKNKSNVIYNDFKMSIWIIGGTSESARLVKAIAFLQIPCIITITTDSAKSLYPPETNLLKIWLGKLDPKQIYDFLEHHKIKVILDASHPFAVEISKLAIATSQKHHIPYLRFERPVVEQNLLSTHTEVNTNIIFLNNLETLLSGDYLTKNRVLLTLGYRTLPQFQPWQNQTELFARILPSPVALETALNSGFTPDRIIAIRPPISEALETALWQQWNISLVVTKSSGTAGGEDIKIKVANNLGIPLIILERPAINYPQKTDSLEEAIQFCQQ